MPIMCEECKCSNWSCDECGESNHNDCGCPCCGCKCQTKEDEKWCDDCGKNVPYTSEGCACQDSTALAVHIDNQPTERSNTMTTEAPVVTPDQQKIVYLEEQKVALEKRVDALTVDLATNRSIVDEHRRKVSRLFTKVNDWIEEQDAEEDTEISLGELDDILYGVYGSRLVFDKEYEIQVQHIVYATFTVRAKDEETASTEAERFEMYEPTFDTTPDSVEFEVDRVVYSQRKEK